MATTQGTRTPAHRRPIACIAWTAQTVRADEIASNLGGVSRRFDGRLPARKETAPARYVINAIETLWWLLRRRPRAVVVQNPPIVLPLIAWAWCAVTGATFVLDSHPTAFGRKGSRLWAFFLPVHRWLARRAAVVLVTVDELADEVRTWGGRALLLHEAPPEGEHAERAAEPEPRRILFAGVFAEDEPVAEVVAAAAMLPDVEVHVTGDVRKAPPGMVDGAPPNVRFLGFLDQRRYFEAIASAGTVMALTTEPTSVVRAGYEAVYARRALIVSDWPTLRDVFPFAVHTGHDAASLADAMRVAVEEHERLAADVETAAAEQLRRWDAQLAALRAALGA